MARIAAFAILSCLITLLSACGLHNDTAIGSPAPTVNEALISAGTTSVMESQIAQGTTAFTDAGEANADNDKAIEAIEEAIEIETVNANLADSTSKETHSSPIQQVEPTPESSPATNNSSPRSTPIPTQLKEPESAASGLPPGEDDSAAVALPTPSTLEPAPEQEPELEPTPAPTPTPLPTHDIQQARALFSYEDDINTARPLEGAVLEQRRVYIFWQAPELAKVVFYCCKGIDGDANGEWHNIQTSVNDAPFRTVIDMSEFTTEGRRELYVDFTTSTGHFYSDNFTSFELNITDSSPAYSIDATLSWDAPQNREDGEALQPNEIHSYRITYSEPPHQIHTEQIPASLRRWSIRLYEGDYSFRISTVDREGRSSEDSEVLDCSIHRNGSRCE